MSPEQHAGLPSSEASDWYSVGIMLQEVLTGCPSAPQDLRELCSDLLQQDPRDRPSGPQICDRLGVTPVCRRRQHGRLHLLAGRSISEHCRKRSIYQRRDAQLRSYIHGSSGIGKSALAHRFLELVQESEEVVVLAGRCYERESVPYKAIDGLIDALSIHLKSLSVDVLDQLLPEIPAVARMFPVLRRVHVPRVSK